MVKKYAADPKAPKRPLSAYFLFAASVRDEVVDSIKGDFNISKVGKKIGKMWAELSNAKKSPFQKKAEAAHAKWEKANTKYKGTPGYAKWCEGREEHKKAQQAEAKRNHLKSLIPNKPKKGPNAYMRFCKANRHKHSGSLVEVSQALGHAWSKASKAVKGKFESMVAKDHARYEKAMAKYVKTDEYHAYEAAFKEHRSEQYKIKTYGSVSAANKAERARLAAKANKKKEQERKARARAKARKAAIKA